uniref:TGF-beta family profile domain-containing protein n=1 Tax=Pseudonaja textilis TaxID=8673 RepID=A0A670XZV1_PSETE
YLLRFEVAVCLTILIHSRGLFEGWQYCLWYPSPFFLPGKNVAMQDLNTSELLRTAHSPSHSRNAKRNPRRSGRGTCRLHSRALNVQDLGLGYKTEEVVLFKYCSGSCESSITNYDQILNYIMQKGLVPAEKDFVSKPCCRPLRFENFSFLDIYNVWQNVEKGSAAACGCVG